ncbi:MAG: hypothetical protein ACOVNK_05885 [Sphingorhabdus lacus]
MRLLIYLLAMLTGFSAAEAARPVSATPATLGSAVSSAAIVAASVSIAERHETTRPLRTYETTVQSAKALVWPAFDRDVFSFPTPVTAHDVLRL